MRAPSRSSRSASAFAYGLSIGRQKQCHLPESRRRTNRFEFRGFPLVPNAPVANDGARWLLRTCITRGSIPDTRVTEYGTGIDLADAGDQPVFEHRLPVVARGIGHIVVDRDG